MADGEATMTDADIALMMATGDEGGLRLLLERYGGRMKAFLVKFYRSTLQEGELDEAFNVAIFNVWRFADRYDESKGSLPSWCIRIAQRAAQSIIRRETSYRSKSLEYDDTYDPASPSGGDGDEPPSLDDGDPKWNLVLKAIEMLPPLQKAIVKADLAADGTADAQRLAEIHGTSKNSIYVSRNKAHENLKKRVDELARQPAGTRR